MIMLLTMLVCLCVSVCVSREALQAHQNACGDDADYDAGLSVRMYLGRPCRLTDTHVMLMMVLVCLCVCTWQSPAAALS